MTPGARPVAAANSAAAMAGGIVQPVTIANVAAAEIGDGEGQVKDVWLPLVERYGEYTGVMSDEGNDLHRVVQIIDKEGAEKIVAKFGAFIKRLAHMFKGVPILEGHPDEERWLDGNPSPPSGLRAVGRIKAVEAREDSVWAHFFFNRHGVELLSGEAPIYTAFSPRFGVEEVGARPDGTQVVRVNDLFSVGLTDTPNLPGTHFTFNNAGTGETQILNTKMNPELLSRLGLAEGATQEEIEAAMNAALDQRDTLQNAAAAAASNGDGEDDDASAANAGGEGDDDDASAANAGGEDDEASKAAANAVKKAAKVVVNSALQAGKITKAEVPQWEAALIADFDAESAKLDAKMGTVVNSGSKLPGNLGARRGEGSPTTFKAAVANAAKREGLDLSKPADYQKASSIALKEMEEAEAEGGKD